MLRGGREVRGDGRDGLDPTVGVADGRLRSMENAVHTWRKEGREVSSYDEFFSRATGHTPLPYQHRLATGPWPARVEIPTGLGKTYAVVLAWLWRRENSNASGIPRRLVYCLPMRVLVEQTRDVVASVLNKLGLADRVRLVVLMGGLADDDEWDRYPEGEAIIIGTQDMLLSRALDRGYGMSRYRWPLHFGLLNNDCQWLVDEVQLLGAGVSTTAQLQAFRRKLGTAQPSRTTWLSATLQEDWLRTVDVEDVDLDGVVRLEEEDLAHSVAARRVRSRKTLRPTTSIMGAARELASEILEAHRPGTRTLVLLNTVDRAVRLYEALVRSKPAAPVVLVHSRYRPPDRRAHLDDLLASPGEPGLIAVSTQVVEAGVDVSSATLFTEMAPWASMVQRFGRCNREGEHPDACVYVVRLPSDEKERQKLAPPYELVDLVDSERIAGSFADAGPASLPRVPLRMGEHAVIRRRDLCCRA